MKKTNCFQRVVFLLAIAAVRCHAQQPVPPQEPWSSRPVIQVWPGVAPGSEQDTRKEVLSPSPLNPNVHVVRNVTTPTLTVFQPKGGNTTGAAVLICPGGGFRILAIEEEGYEVADWFVQHGVTAFVLRYRLAETPASDAEFAPPGEPVDKAIQRFLATPLPKNQVPMSISDGVQALKVVRANAGKYGFRPDHIVAVGFSAGGTVVTGMSSAPVAGDRPNYVASIYGAFLPELPVPPKDAPPFFLVMADDDPLVQPMVLRLFTSLRDEGASPELHVYRNGAHGFSMHQVGTSDEWLQELWWWMVSFKLAAS